MKSEELKAITDSIEEKIGKENSGLIADDLGKLFTLNKQTIDTMSKMENENANLKSTNEKLVVANGNLLQQIPMTPDYSTHQTKSEEVEEKKSFNFRDAFDSKGNFIR